MRRAAVAVIAFFALLTPAFVAGAQTEITPADIAAPEEKRRAISADLASVAAEDDTAVAELIELENSLTELGVALAEKEQELATARVAARGDRLSWHGEIAAAPTTTNRRPCTSSASTKRGSKVWIDPVTAIASKRPAGNSRVASISMSSTLSMPSSSRHRTINSEAFTEVPMQNWRKVSQYKACLDVPPTG